MKIKERSDYINALANLYDCAISSQDRQFASDIKAEILALFDTKQSYTPPKEYALEFKTMEGLHFNDNTCEEKEFIK